MISAPRNAANAEFDCLICPDYSPFKKQGTRQKALPAVLRSGFYVQSSGSGFEVRGRFGLHDAEPRTRTSNCELRTRTRNSEPKNTGPSDYLAASVRSVSVKYWLSRTEQFHGTCMKGTVDCRSVIVCSIGLRYAPGSSMVRCTVRIWLPSGFLPTV